LADFSAADVVELTIYDGDGNQLALAKNGDKWILDQTDNFPADSEKISPFLEKLEGIKTNRLITQTEASHKRLKVAGDDFNRMLEITLLDGSSQKLYLGSSAGAGATHVRVDDQPEVYLTDAVSSFEASTQASGWIDTLYYTIPQTATVALTLENQNGTFEFEKDGEDWVMKGLAEDETLKESAVTGLLSQATSVRMTTPLGKKEQPSYGLDEPLAVVTLKTGEGDESKTQTLRIGAKDDEDSSYVVSYSESPYYVRVSQYTGNTFVEKTRDDFLEPPPTPEANEENPDAAISN
jgi:YD repeat-containing protein